jgi:hypothetical protein
MQPDIPHRPVARPEIDEFCPELRGESIVELRAGLVR